MNTITKVEAYLIKQSRWETELRFLRDIILKTGLVETIKWGAPVYTLDGKNVVGLGAFKNHFGLWFFQGVFLKDKRNLLINAQEGTTKALRQLRFKEGDQLDEEIISEYVLEAIQNQRNGKELKPQLNKGKVVIPKELDAAFKSTSGLEAAFQALTPGKQREYAEHVGSAKQEKTRLSRVDKIIPMIQSGVGLHDKYKNC